MESQERGGVRERTEVAELRVKQALRVTGVLTGCQVSRETRDTEGTEESWVLMDLSESQEKRDLMDLWGQEGNQANPVLGVLLGQGGHLAHLASRVFLELMEYKGLREIWVQPERSGPQVNRGTQEYRACLVLRVPSDCQERRVPRGN